jgi:Family of unknown function (DUF6069)
VGSTALAISMTGPSYLSDGADAVALMAMHLLVGATLIYGFATSHPSWPGERQEHVSGRRAAGEWPLALDQSVATTSTPPRS